MLKRILERYCFDVDEAGNGEIGLDLLKRKRYDLTIIDFLMPIMDGITCVGKFRQWETDSENKPDTYDVRADGRAFILGSSANADARATTRVL